jgi:hypothetical protein
MEALILVATSGGPTIFARIGVMRALNPHLLDSGTSLRGRAGQAVPRVAATR